MLTVRLPCQHLKPTNIACGSLYFGDGSQKGLAALGVWVALCLAADLPHNSSSPIDHPNVKALAASLLRIRTVMRGASGGPDVDSQISRIIKQNMDARVQPVSSLTWLSVLRNMGEGVGVDVLIQKYNQHPEVVAAGTTLALDNKKKQEKWLGVGRY